MSQAFISYSRADTAFADKLTQDLERRGIPVWIDRENIEGGAAWRASISKAIRSCCAFILILSPRSTQSGQVSKELSVAETHNRLIIPVVLEKCDIPPGMELQLAELQWISFAEHPYDAALERLTRVITEARLRAADASKSGAHDAAPGASPVIGRAAVPRPAASPHASVAANPGSSRKWLLAGSAAIVAVGATVAGFQFVQNRSANITVEHAGRTDTKAAPAEPPASAPEAVPVVAAVGDGKERGATRSAVRERTVAAPEKPAVLARVDPGSAKPENVPRGDAAAAQVPGPVVANTRTRLYHFPGCPSYSRIAPQARIEFANARDAERAGYRLSDNCADPSGGRAAAAVIANSRTRDYFLPHCNGYAATRPEYRVPFNSTAQAEQAGYRRSDKCS